MEHFSLVEHFESAAILRMIFGSAEQSTLIPFNDEFATLTIP
jgi:hypothetical protein